VQRRHWTESDKLGFRYQSESGVVAMNQVALLAQYVPIPRERRGTVRLVLMPNAL